MCILTSVTVRNLRKELKLLRRVAAQSWAPKAPVEDPAMTRDASLPAMFLLRAAQFGTEGGIYATVMPYVGALRELLEPRSSSI